MAIAIFTLGLVVGSFLNAYIWRTKPSPHPLPEGEGGRGPGEGKSVWRGRSYCPKCKKPLSWYELIPLLSFFVQLGRCRGCGKKIDWQYPIVELVTGVLFLLAYGKLDISIFSAQNIETSLFSIVQFYLLAVLVVLFVYDLRYGLVPDKVVLPAIAVALIYNIVVTMSLQLVTWSLLAIAVGALFFALQYYLSKGRWLGAGDIRIGALMGAMAGWPLIFVALVISYLIGGAFAGILLIFGKKRFGQTLPLGTFLTLGAAVVFLYGEQIWQWYWR